MGLTQRLGTIPLAIQTDSSNNVGIGGAANASYKLDVTGTIRATGSIFGDVGFRTKSLNGYLLKNDADSANLGGLVRRSYWAGGAALDTQIFAETGYGIFLNVNGSSSTGMVINSSGNVGIGLSNPTALLEILGAQDGVANKCLRLAYNGTYYGEYTEDSIRAFNNPLIFGTGTGGTERMRITSGGDVGIGGSISNQRLYVKAATSNGTTNAFLIHNSNGSDLFFVRSDGAFFINSFTYNNTVSGGTRNVFIDNSFALGGISSIRASKTNIQSITNNNWIYQLKPVSFNYRKKDEEGNYTEEYFDEITYGLIAEDTAPIADFLINYNDKEDGTKEMVGIEYMRLITPMLKSIQEQKKLIDELSAKVTALENK